MDAVLAFQEAVGVFALDGDGGGFDARLVPVLVVQDFIGEALPLHPAGVHAVEHLGPVLGLGAAGPGVELQNGVAPVVLPGEEGGHPRLGGPVLQGGALGFQLLQNLGVVGLLAHLAQGRQVLPGGDQLLLPGDFVLELFQPLLDLLGALQVVPEPVLGGLVLQARGLLPGGLDVQGGGELVKLRFQLPELLLVGVVFNQSHIDSPSLQISQPMYYIGGEFICKEKDFHRGGIGVFPRSPFLPGEGTARLLSFYDTKMLPLVHSLFMIMRGVSAMV